MKRPAARKQLPKGRAQKGRSAASPVTVPISPKRLWQVLAGGFAVLLVAAVGVWAVAANVPRDIALGLATLGAKSGFTVRQVDIQGVTHQPRLSIYREVLVGGSDSMFLVDLPATRERLQALPWVRDVSIARRWPNRIEVVVQERKPAALWQYQGKMRLIDTEGEVLPVDDLARWAKMPLLVGAEARHEARDLIRLINVYPDLATQLRGAQWLGQGRWDLLMVTGETISLPRGAIAEAALRAFARENAKNQLLGRGFARFDLRIPDKMVVQVKTEGGVLPKPRVAPVPPAVGVAPMAAPTESADAAPQQEVVI